MVYVNLQVRHIKFGLGTIIELNGKYITVRFDTCTKSFVYPDAFERFLTLADGSVSDEILADLALAKEEKARLAEKKNQENIHSMTHGIVIPGKETTVDSDEDSKYRDNDDN